MTDAIPVDVLEKRAAEQRRQLHNSVIELRQSVKDRLDVKRNVREHLWSAAGALAVIGLVVGYAVAGVFTSD
ncbi:MAG TPA: hypothetical protein VE783_04300 [Candidatus Limnocylindrales bacterium]|jgi:ElaB/YqjD/DUF883 family membrane-anchored ribosome-binding protein|nr:hypothetical protein [Candidatus Limnocylindrales bacterium]